MSKKKEYSAIHVGNDGKEIIQAEKSVLNIIERVHKCGMGSDVAVAALEVVARAHER
jgi:hypothetical protein